MRTEGCLSRRSSSQSSPIISLCPLIYNTWNSTLDSISMYVQLVRILKLIHSPVSWWWWGTQERRSPNLTNSVTRQIGSWRVTQPINDSSPRLLRFTANRFDTNSAPYIPGNSPRKKNRRYEGRIIAPKIDSSPRLLQRFTRGEIDVGDPYGTTKPRRNIILLYARSGKRLCNVFSSFCKRLAIRESVRKR